MYKDPSSREPQRRYGAQKLGPLFILLGVGLLILYIFNFAVSMSNGLFPVFFFLPMIAIPLIIIGVITTYAGYRKDMPRYTTNRPNPSNPMSNPYRFMPPASAYKNAPGDITIGINPSSPKKIKCRACGQLSNSGTTYCSHCGQKLR